MDLYNIQTGATNATADKADASTPDGTGANATGGQGQETDRCDSPRFTRIIDHLLQSDHEMDETGDMDMNQPPLIKVERMSLLSKLNLLGLINVSEIVLRLKLSGNLDDAVRLLERAIKDLSSWNETKLKPSSQPTNHIGIASQNIMEEYLEKLNRAKDIEVAEDEYQKLID